MSTRTPARVQGIPITLGDQQYILPPASLATLECMAAPLDALNTKLAGGGTPSLSDFGTVIDLVLACLQRNYPDLERLFVAQQLGLENMSDVMTMCFDTSGLLRKAHEAQTASEHAAAQGGGTLGESHGAASSPTS